MYHSRREGGSLTTLNEMNKFTMMLEESEKKKKRKKKEMRVSRTFSLVLFEQMFSPILLTMSYPSIDDKNQRHH